MTALYHAHSGLRYLVLLAGVAALLVLAYGVIARKPVGAGRGLSLAFTGLLDLQIVLGLVLVAGGMFYGALMGHLTMMLLAGVAAHVASVLARRAADERRAATLRLAGVAVALLLIVGGIMAIGRSLVGSAPPTVAG